MFARLVQANHATNQYAAHTDVLPPVATPASTTAASSCTTTRVSGVLCGLCLEQRSHSSPCGVNTLSLSSRMQLGFIGVSTIPWKNDRAARAWSARPEFPPQPPPTHPTVATNGSQRAAQEEKPSTHKHWHCNWVDAGSCARVLRQPLVPLHCCARALRRLLLLSSTTDSPFGYCAELVARVRRRM